MEEVVLLKILDKGEAYDKLEMSVSGKTFSYISNNKLITIAKNNEIVTDNVKNFKSVTLFNKDSLLIQQNTSVAVLDVEDKQKMTIFANDNSKRMFLHSFDDCFIIVNVGSEVTDFCFYNSSFKTINIPQQSTIYNNCSYNKDNLVLFNNENVFIVQPKAPYYFKMEMPVSRMYPFSKYSFVAVNNDLSLYLSVAKKSDLMKVNSHEQSQEKTEQPAQAVGNVYVLTIHKVVPKQGLSNDEYKTLFEISNNLIQFDIELESDVIIEKTKIYGKLIALVTLNNKTKERQIVIANIETKDIQFCRKGKSVEFIESEFPLFVIDGETMITIPAKSKAEIASKLIVGGFEHLANRIMEQEKSSENLTMIQIEHAIDSENINQIKDIVKKSTNEDILKFLTTLQDFVTKVKKDKSLDKNGQMSRYFDKLFIKYFNSDIVDYEEVQKLMQTFIDSVQVRNEYYNQNKVADQKLYDEEIEKNDSLRINYEKMKAKMDKSLELIHYEEEVPTPILMESLYHDNLNTPEFKQLIDENGWKMIYYFLKDGNTNDAFKLLLRFGQTNIISIIKQIMFFSIDKNFRCQFYQYLEDELSGFQESMSVMKSIDSSPAEEVKPFEFVLTDIKDSGVKVVHPTVLESDYVKPEQLDEHKAKEKIDIKVGDKNEFKDNEITIERTKEIEIPFFLLNKLSSTEKDEILLEHSLPVLPNNNDKPKDELTFNELDEFKYQCEHNNFEKTKFWLENNPEIFLDQQSVCRNYLNLSTESFQRLISDIIDHDNKLTSLSVRLMQPDYYLPFFDISYGNSMEETDFPYEWMRLWKYRNNYKLAFLLTYFKSNNIALPTSNDENDLFKQLPSSAQKDIIINQLFDIPEKPVTFDFDITNANMQTTLKDTDIFQLYEYIFKKKHEPSDAVMIPFVRIPSDYPYRYTFDMNYYISNNEIANCLRIGVTQELIKERALQTKDEVEMANLVLLSDVLYNVSKKKERKEIQTIRLENLVCQSLQKEMLKLKINEKLNKYVRNTSGLTINISAFDVNAKYEFIKFLDEVCQLGEYRESWDLLPYLCQLWSIEMNSTPLKTMAYNGDILNFIHFADCHGYKKEMLPTKWGSSEMASNGACFIKRLMNEQNSDLTLNSLIPIDSLLHFVLTNPTLQSFMIAIKTLIETETDYNGENENEYAEATLDELKSVISKNIIDHIDLLELTYALFDHKSPIYYFIEIVNKIRYGLVPSTDNLKSSIKEQQQHFGDCQWVIDVIEMILDKNVFYYEKHSPYRMTLLLDACQALSSIESISKSIERYKANQKISTQYSLDISASSTIDEVINVLCEKEMFVMAYDYVEKFDFKGGSSYSKVVINESSKFGDEWEKVNEFFVQKEIAPKDAVAFYQSKYDLLKEKDSSVSSYREMNFELSVILNYELEWVKKARTMGVEEERIVKLLRVYEQCIKENISPDYVLTPTKELLLNLINMGNITVSKTISETIQIPECDIFFKVVDFVSNAGNYQVTFEEGINTLNEFEKQAPKIKNGIEVFKNRYCLLKNYCIDITPYLSVMDSTFRFYEKRLELVEEALCTRNLTKFATKPKEWINILNNVKEYSKTEKIRDEDLVPVLATRFIEISSGVQPVMKVGWRPDVMMSYVTVLNDPSLLVNYLVANIDTKNLKLVSEIAQCSYVAANIADSPDDIDKVINMITQLLPQFEQPENYPYLFDLIIKSKAFDDFNELEGNEVTCPLRKFMKGVFTGQFDYRKLMIKNQSTDLFMYQAYFLTELQNILDSVEAATENKVYQPIVEDMFGYLNNYDMGARLLYKEAEKEMEFYMSDLRAQSDPVEGVSYLVNATKYYNIAYSFYTMDNNGLLANSCFYKIYLNILQLMYSNVQLIGLSMNAAIKQLNYFKDFYDAFYFMKAYGMKDEAETWIKPLVHQCVLQTNSEYFKQWQQCYSMTNECLETMNEYLTEVSPKSKRKETMNNFEKFKKKCKKIWVHLNVSERVISSQGVIDEEVKKQIQTSKLSFTFLDFK